MMKTIAQYISALHETLPLCEFRHAEQDMLRDQTVEKVCSGRLCECLQLEVKLTLDKTIQTDSQVESVVA